MGPEQIIADMKASGLRGRRRRWFPEGLKWSFMPKNNTATPQYLVVNADESEPGTCKDREIMRHDPHKLVEGCLDRGHRDARVGRLHLHPRRVRVRGHHPRERHQGGVRRRLYRQERVRHRHRLRRRAAPRRRRVHLRRGDGAHRELEGKPGKPRLKPPFPANAGLYGCPTTVANVGDRVGRADDPAPRPRVVCRLWAEEQRGHEALLHLRPREQPDHRRGGDVDPDEGAAREALQGRDRRLGQPLGCDPGWLVGAGPDQGPLRRGADGLRRPQVAEVGLGTAAVTVFNKSVDIVAAIARLSKFYEHESCGQCTPCREGTGWMRKIMDRLVTGDAEIKEIDMLEELSYQIEGHTICALGDGRVAGPGLDPRLPAGD